MKVLVVHASRSGWAEEVATHAARALATDGHDVDLVGVDDAPAPDGNDSVLLFAGVRAKAWNAGGVAYLREHADALRGLRLGLATVSLSVLGGAKAVAASRAIVEPLLAETGLEPVARAELAGGYDPERVNFAERMMMKAMNQATVNAVDAEAAARFARGVVAPM